MNRRQLLALFFCSLIPWWIGSGLVPLLPLYAARLGASPAVVGNYLSLIFFTLATGTMLGGWLSAKLRHHRELLIGVGILGVPATWMIGQVTIIWQLIALSAATWFAFGITLALVAVIAGQSAAEHERGRIFGLLAMTSALGGVLGGPTGFIADHWGYPALFAVVACAWLLQILAAAFLQNPALHKSPPETRAESSHKETGHAPNPANAQSRPARLATAYLVLLATALLFSAGNFSGTLGRSLAMEAQGFTNATITLLAALGSGAGLFVNPLLGQLSDRVDRRWLLCLLYLMGSVALVGMAYATTVLAFAIVGLLTAVSGAERGISAALVSDILPPHELGQGLSLFESIKWIGAVVGLAGIGYVIQQIGLSQALMVSALLPLLALTLLFLTRKGITKQITALRPAPTWPVPQADSTL